MDLSQRLDEMELAIHKPSFRKGTGRANEVNYWVFDYPPEKELEVRERVEYLKNKNDRGDDDFELVVFDPYDIIIDFLEKKNFMDKCYDFEKKRGIERIVKAVTNSMKVNDDDSLIVQYIKEHTPENAVVFLIGIGKCYPILRSHKVLNNLHQAFVRCPVVMFFPGTYNEQELILFNEINVILIDEFDKVNPALYNAFYELFDEGKYVDTNYSVELGQAIFLLTCNFSNENEIKKALGPAMFSRIGCCVEYADLTVEQKQKIVNNWYDSIMASLKDDERVYIETTDIHEWFLKNAERYDNIRILKSKMENAIFEKLTDHFIIMTGSMAEGTQDSV